MMRHTGGCAFGAISTRSNPAFCARLNASRVGTMPICSPVALTQRTGDTRVLDALNEMFGRAAFDVSPHAQVSDAALLELLTQLGIEKGEFHQALHDALTDGRFTAKELQLIRGRAFDLVGALMTLVARVEGLLDA